MLGTFIYAAPEALAEAKAVTALADVYSLAMTAIFALSGSRLPPEILWNTSDFIQNLEVSVVLRRVLAKAVDRDLASRTSSIEKFCQALSDAMSSE